MKIKFYMMTSVLLIISYLFNVFGKRMDFLWRGAYIYVIYLLLIVGIVGWKRGDMLRFPYYFIFLPLAVFPAIRCYFKVPYVFCRVCPIPCTWGEMRKVFIPAFLVMNFNNRSWCFKMCPFGTLQDYQARIVKKRIRFGWLKHIRYLVLIGVIVAVVYSYWNIFPRSLFTGAYEPIIGVIAIGIGFVIISFFNPRFFCNHFCPIGTVGDMTLKCKKRCRIGKAKK